MNKAGPWSGCPVSNPDPKNTIGLFVQVHIRRERWIVLMLSPILRNVQRQRCWKRGSGDGQRLCPYDYGMTERSLNAVERWGSTLTWTVCTAADSEERQICMTCLFAEGVGLWKDDGLTLSLIVEHTSVWEGVGERGEIWRAIPQWNTKDQLPKPQTATVATVRGPSKAAYVKQHIPEQRGWKNSKYWANIEKRNQINTKNYCKVINFRTVPIFVLLTWNWFVRTNFRTFERLKTKLH